MSRTCLQRCTRLAKRTEISKCFQQQRRQVSFGGMAEKRVLTSITNGILESNDDYLRNGIPRATFSLSEKESLEDLLNQHRSIDPFQTAQSDIARVSESLQDVIGSDHMILRQVAAHFFENSGKFLRPAVVCLMSRALQADAVANGTADNATGPTERQLSLALITELIHTASLLHDDVIDESATRRGVASVHSVYGNKLAILGGDYLLARASVGLARLRDCDVTEIMSMVIEHLVKGEMMQLKPVGIEGDHKDQFSTQLQGYLTKSYYKTASLIDNSCKSSAKLGIGLEEKHIHIASEYGKNLGIAFQLVDDILDFEGSASLLGKPTFNDLKQGMATLPVLIASNDYPHLTELIKRKFKQDGDVQKAVDCVQKSGSIKSSKVLAEEFGGHAVAAVLELSDSPARRALISLVHRVLNRDR